MTEQTKSTLKTAVWVSIGLGLAYATYRAFAPVKGKKSLSGARTKKRRKK